MTRLIERIFSAMDKNETDILDQIRSDCDAAIKDGSKDTVQLKYVKLPEKTIDITDKENGEHTIIKKSGSCMMMKSSNKDGMFSIPSGYNTYKNYLQLFSADNDDDFHTFTTKAFNFLGKDIPSSTDIKSEEDRINITNNIKKLREEVEKNNESLVKKEQKLSSDDKLTDAKAERLKSEVDVLKIKNEIAKNNIDGSESQLKRDQDSFEKNLIKASKLRADLDKYKQIAQKKKENDEQEKLEKQLTNENNSGDKDKMKKNLNNDYVSKSRKFSKSGYSDEREKIVSLLLNLLETKDNKHKSKVLSGLESISNNITDNKIKTIIKSMISELKKISINDSQYDQIISDTIDNMKSDGIIKLFSDKSLEAITRFYAYGDMADNPNRQGYQQYVNDRRDTRLRALRNAAIGAGALYAGQQFVKNGGWDRLKNWWSGVNLNGNGAANGGSTLGGGRVTTQAVDPNQVTYIGDGTATVAIERPDLTLGNAYNIVANKVGGYWNSFLDKFRDDPNEISTHRVDYTGRLVDQNGNVVPATGAHHQSSYFVQGGNQNVPQQQGTATVANNGNVAQQTNEATSDASNNVTAGANGSYDTFNGQPLPVNHSNGNTFINEDGSWKNLGGNKSVPVGKTYQVADNTSVRNTPNPPYVATNDSALHQGNEIGGDRDNSFIDELASHDV